MLNDLKSPPVNSYDVAMAAIVAADDRKGADISLIKVSDVSYLADYFVFITGFSTTQVKAIAESIEKDVEENLELLPLRREGKSDGRWILLDYGDVIIHVMLPDDREYYNIEAFWGHAEKVEFELPSP
jgi:ribosome-associated protein